MDLSREILTAEIRFLRKLEEFFLSVFPGTNLESHGLTHHQRVWSYAKELLCYPETKKLSPIELLPVKMIIASYLHDIGMSVDPSPNHGIISRNFCEKFLRENDLIFSDFTDLLDAVENHDDKEYRTSQVNNPLLQILSVADDLDAFGYIGIYRYIEIYLMRGVGYEELGENIVKNVTIRFNNLKKSFGYIPQLMESHQPRYDTIKSFFNSYNDQLSSYTFGTGTPSGYCGVAEMIGKMVSEKIKLNDLVTFTNSRVSDQTIEWYFRELEKEMIT